MSNETNGFGKPKYGNGYAKNFRLKEGSFVCRIMPPMKLQAETGTWAMYGGVHFGYKGVNSKDPSKTVFRTFKCIKDRDFRSGATIVACAECDLIEAREAEKKTGIENLIAKGATKKDAEETFSIEAAWLKEHNCDRKWRMNIKTQGNEYGTLYLSHRTKKVLDKKISNLLSEDGVDALDLDQGVWFRFERTGKGVDTMDTVDVEYESTRDATTRTVSKTLKLAPLTAAEAEQALRECQELSTIDKEISSEQITLLTECSGDPEEVDRIFELGQKVAAPAPTPARQAAPKTPAPKAEENVTDIVAKLQAQLAAAQAQVKANKAMPPAVSDLVNDADTDDEPVSAAPSKAPASVAPPGGVSKEDFMARFRNK